MPVSEEVPLTAFTLELKHALSTVGKTCLRVTAPRERNSADLSGEVWPRPCRWLEWIHATLEGGVAVQQCPGSAFFITSCFSVPVPNVHLVVENCGLTGSETPASLAGLSPWLPSALLRLQTLQWVDPPTSTRPHSACPSLLLSLSWESLSGFLSVRLHPARRFVPSFLLLRQRVRGKRKT